MTTIQQQLNNTTLNSDTGTPIGTPIGTTAGTTSTAASIDTSSICCAFGTLFINEFGNGFVNLVEPQITVYIPKQNIGRAYHLENVEVEYTVSSQNQDQYTGRIINYSLIGKVFAGIVHHIYKTSVFIYVPELKLSNLVQITTPQILAKLNWVQIRITKDTPLNEPIIGELIMIIPNALNDVIAVKFNLAPIPPLTTPLPSLRINEFDLTHLETFTVDPQGSLDCDDAFSVQMEESQARIYVHIANVAYYFNPETTPPELWDTITTRGTTYYGVEHTNWPMIPSQYANVICSILPAPYKTDPTHVLTCEFVYNIITREITLVSQYCARVRSMAKLDYDTVDKMLKEKTNPAIQVLLNAAAAIRDTYKDFIFTEETPAHWMVRYWMIHVNTVMCRNIYRYNPIPEPSRQETISRYINPNYNIPLPREDLVTAVNNFTSDELLMYLGKVAMLKSKYTTDPKCNYHYGIGVHDYTHWTSPIRRLPDLLNHCCLLEIPISASEMAVYLDRANTAEMKQDQIEWFIRTWNHAGKFNVGSQVSAVIINVMKTGVAVYVYELEGKYTLHISKLTSVRLEYDGEKLKSIKSDKDDVSFKLFDTLTLKISKMFFDVIEFDVIKPD